jgi:hypothetical protein
VALVFGRYVNFREQAPLNHLIDRLDKAGLVKTDQILLTANVVQVTAHNAAFHDTQALKILPTGKCVSLCTPYLLESVYPCVIAALSL